MAAVFEKIAVCGAGAMGAGIAQIAAQSGAHVLVFDVSADALAESEEHTRAGLAKLAERGKLTPEQADDTAARMAWVSTLDALTDRELVIEAIFEDADVKAGLYEKLEAVVASDAIIATNTSSLPISRLARTLEHPRRFVGMHFFNPATVMKLVEVIAGAATDPNVVDRIVATAQAWGKVAIPVADVPGFIVNRVARPYYAEGFTALNEGTPAPAIDALFRSAGFRMGPLELTDLIGQDVNFEVGRSVFASYFGRTRFVPQLRQASLVEAGMLGCKSGRGIYDYGDDAAKDEAELITPAEVAGSSRQVAEQMLSAKPGEMFVLEGVSVGKTAGRTALVESRALGVPVALFDWFSDDSGGPIGFSLSDEQALPAATGVLAGLSRPGVRIADRPGLIVARAFAQIVNAAADAVLEQVADEGGIDAALRFGANYPFGPFAWADRFGRANLIGLLDAIADETGESFYRPSQYVRRWS